MRAWINNNAFVESLSEQRSMWARRGIELAHVTRDRGVSALESVRSGTLDWQATLEARRVELSESAPAWFRFRGLQIFVVDRAESALVGFGERLRAHMQRLGQLELAPAAEADAQAVAALEETPAARKKPSARKPGKAASTKAASTKPASAKAQGPALATRASKASKAKPTPSARRKKVATKRTKSTRFLMPIADYDGLTAKQAIAEIADLSAAQRKQIEAHEKAHKNRKTVLAALAR